MDGRYLRPVLIPNGIAGNVLEQLEAQPLGVTITAKNLPNSSEKDDPYGVLSDALSRWLGQISGSRDVSLPDNFLRIVVMPRPCSLKLGQHPRSELGVAVLEFRV